MRSLARDFSSSRRAPPNAASNPPSASASSSARGLQQAAALLCSQLERIGAVRDRFLDCVCTISLAPIRAGYRSRNSIISRNL